MEGRVWCCNGVWWGSCARLRARWLGLPRPLLLLLVQLVQRLSHDVVFLPIHRRAAHDVLRLWDGRKLGRTGCAGIGRVLARVCAGLAIFRANVRARHRICEAVQRRSEDVAVGLRGLLSALLYGAHKASGVGDGDRLELGQGLQVALALLALQLQQRDGGAQGDDIWVLAL